MELVARFSDIDLDSEKISDYLRLEGFYGVGRFDRFSLRGTTQFFQARLHFEF